MYEVAELMCNNKTVGVRVFSVLSPGLSYDIDIETINKLGLRIKDVYRTIVLQEHNGFLSSRREIKVNRFSLDISNNTKLVRQLIKTYNSLHSGESITRNLDVSIVESKRAKYLSGVSYLSVENRIGIIKDMLRGVQVPLLIEMYNLGSPSVLQPIVSDFNVCLWYRYLSSSTKSRIINDLSKFRPLRFICEKYLISMNLAITIANKGNLPIHVSQLPKEVIEVVKSGLLSGLTIRDIGNLVSVNRFLVMDIAEESGIDLTVSTIPADIKEMVRRLSIEGSSINEISQATGLIVPRVSGLLKFLGLNVSERIVSDADKLIIKRDLFTSKNLSILISQHKGASRIFNVAEEFGIIINISEINKEIKDKIWEEYKSGASFEVISERLGLFYGIVHRVVKDYRSINPKVIKKIPPEVIERVREAFFTERVLNNVQDMLSGGRSHTLTLANYFGIVIRVEDLSPDTFNAIYRGLQSGVSVRELAIRYNVFYGLVFKLSIKLKEGLLELKTV